MKGEEVEKPQKSMKQKLSNILHKDSPQLSIRESEILQEYENIANEYGLQGQGQSMAEDKDQDLDDTDEYIQMGYNRKEYRGIDKQGSRSINYHSSLIQPLLEVIEEDNYEHFKGPPEEFDDRSINEECVNMYKVSKTSLRSQRSLTRKLPSSKIKSSKFLNFDKNEHVQVVEVYLGNNDQIKDFKGINQFILNKNKNKRSYFPTKSNPYQLNSSGKYYSSSKYKNSPTGSSVKGLENVKSSKYQQL